MYITDVLMYSARAVLQRPNDLPRYLDATKPGYKLAQSKTGGQLLTELIKSHECNI
jgi:hypothetical protein